MAKYCPRCGYPNPDDALFCARCGYQFPQQTSQPPYTPNYPRSKKRKMTIIGGLIAVLILLIAFVVISPSLLTPASVLYSPSQASSNFGGSWTLCESKTGVIYHTDSEYCIKYYNGTTIKKTYQVGSQFLIYVQIPCILYFTNASFETLNSSNSGQPVSLEIGIFHYDNDTAPFIVFTVLKLNINIMSISANASVSCPEYNGFNIVYMGVHSSTSPYVEEKPLALLVASGNNELVIIALNGEYASLGQMENVLSALT